MNYFGERHRYNEINKRKYKEYITKYLYREEKGKKLFIVFL